MAARSAPTTVPRDILLATDLSPRSDRALDRALQLARDWKATIHVVHVLHEEAEFGITGRTWTAPWRELNGLRDDAEHQLLRDLGPIAGEGRIRVHVERGEPGQVICNLAARENFGLIVTGVARNETLGRRLLGDTVDFLVRRAPVPVLVIRNRVHAPYGHVLVATDFSPPSAEALRHALALFPQSKATLVHAYEIPFSGILLVNDSIRAEFRDLGEKAKGEFLRSVDLPKEFSCRLEVGTPAEAIAKSLADEDALVVIGSHGASALKHVLLGSTATRILDQTTADVLVVPFTKRDLARQGVETKSQAV